MSNFLSNIINRHAGISAIVKPRQRGLFESENQAATSLNSGYDFGAMEQESAHQPLDPPGLMAAGQSESAQQASTVHKAGAGKPVADIRETRSRVEDSPASSGFQPIHPAESTFQTPENRDGILMDTRLVQNPEHQLSAFFAGANREEKGTMTQEAAKENSGQAFPDTRALKSPPVPIVRPISTAQKIHGEGESGMLNPSWNIRQIRELLQKETMRESTPTTVTIHIGRIEVKAPDQIPEMGQKETEPYKPELSLEQFLLKREGKSS
jgi:hypothetical protein